MGGDHQQVGALTLGGVSDGGGCSPDDHIEVERTL